jgi:hypothetical protein
MFDVENHTNAPACSSTAWAVDLGNEAGQAMYSLLMMAASQNKSVVVQGTNDCLAWGDRERPLYVVLVLQ